jgi:hypothetical protein
MDSENQTITNRGTGAGGANTNKNGLSFEKQTDLITEMTYQDSIIRKARVGTRYTEMYDKLSFNVSPERTFIRLIKNQLAKYFNLNTKELFDGVVQPDECYYDEFNKILFVIEKKYQNKSGSKIEVLQTGPAKQENLSNVFSPLQIKVVYMYCANYNLKKRLKQVVLDYLNRNDIKVFYEDLNYKNDVIKYILEYPCATLHN